MFMTQVIVWVFLCYLAYGLAASIADCREKHRREAVRAAQAWHPSAVHRVHETRHTHVARPRTRPVQPPSERIGAA